MLPECELNSESDVNVLMREYMTYWIFRNFDVPTADIILFANVSFDVPDKQLDKSKKYHYIFLQHYESDNDQVPFTRQFSMSKVLASSSDYDNSWVSYENSNHFAYITFNKNDGSTERLWFDRDTAITYFLLTGFTTLSDKSLFGNERYGYYEESKKLKHIPFDFDSSFGCNADDLFISDIEELPKEKQAEYFAAYYSIARNIFDNPNNLYAMLAEIDKFPFRENKIKMKNEVYFVKSLEEDLPRTKQIASSTFDFPAPLGPRTQLKLPPKRISVCFANDLKPCITILFILVAFKVSAAMAI